MTSERVYEEGTNLNFQYCQAPVAEWSVNDVAFWASNIKNYPLNVIFCLQDQGIDGETLLELRENEVQSLRNIYNYPIRLSELKKLWLDIKEIQMIIKGNESSESFRNQRPNVYSSGKKTNVRAQFQCASAACRFQVLDDTLMDCCAGEIPHEYFKTIFALAYSFMVTWITSFVMVIVHERVPDMERYPPLPDIFLDNIPRIPWGFHCVEITGVVLFVMWTIVCIFHKHRLVLLRRFFALAGSVFLIRCITMLITSLSVPGSHLQCQKLEYVTENEDMDLFDAFKVRLSRAYHIWSGMGLTIKGVHTCGDYMFSGHTVALTLLNFFLTEYTPRHMYFLHTFTWLLNMFGIFFILAAHEHYAIDVFIGFYITSRLFLYYHTLANNPTMMTLDYTRSRVWFPIFFYLEQSVDGSIPNEYDSMETLGNSLKIALVATLRFFWKMFIQFLNQRKHLRRLSGRGPRPETAQLRRETIGTSTSFAVNGSLPSTYFMRQGQASMRKRYQSFPESRQYSSI